MTIAAGFLCADGVVLCADSQFSTANTKGSGTKLWATSDGPFSLGIAAAGSGILISASVQKISQLLNAEMSVDAVRETVETILIELHQKHVLPLAKLDPDFGLQLLIGVRTAHGFALLETEGSVVVRADHGFRCIGSGADLGDYLLEQLDPTTSTTWGCLVAVRLLDQVKRHSLYCGKDSFILTIPQDSGQPHEWLLPDRIEEIEGFFERVSKATTPVLAAACNLDVSDETFDTILGKFATVAKNERVRAKALEFFRRSAAEDEPARMISDPGAPADSNTGQ